MDNDFGLFHPTVDVGKLNKEAVVSKVCENICTNEILIVREM